MQQPTRRRTIQRVRTITSELDPDTPGSLAAETRDKHSLSASGEVDAQPTDSPPALDPRGGVYVISVASRILNVHPQTLRKYERLGLVTPTRSIGMLRLYSAEDVLRVRLIRYMVNNLGMNLAGVEFALSLVNRIIDLRRRVQDVSRHEAPGRFIERELDEILRDLGAVFPDSLPRV